MDYSGDHVLRTALGNQPAVIGIDRFMSITNMLRFTPVYVLVMRKLFRNLYGIIKLVYSLFHYVY
ncbi:hypothetical protein HanPSC8_Chr04g0161331 [Helianthus annuus]|nr:hypothetical protein HanPSC8_Chr04g0161331 [Helianthus annuus]